tara:strand:+ start:386 stop:865 length:480 start_codon:yes stop_codon:yes gene_type:complete
MKQLTKSKKKAMKLINPILITLNNTLHIKADNLEAVEVDSSCEQELKHLALKDVNWFKQGTPIPQELSDRIEVREVFHMANNNSISRPVSVFKAFLLPEKENKCDGTCADNECICDDLQECLEIVDKKYYTIEEIEKAIDDLGFIYDNVKEAIINNLKK